MNRAVAVHLRYSEFDIRIDRQSKWGNPFIIGRDGDRSAVISKHKTWLWQEIKASRITLQDLTALQGKRLGCHCAPQPCHGDTLSAAAAWACDKLKDPAPDDLDTSDLNQNNLDHEF